MITADIMYERFFPSQFVSSNTGVVNVYNKDHCMTSQTPRPLKAIMNLTTSCTAATFNPNTEILAITSNFTEKAVKLVRNRQVSLRVKSQW